MHLKKYKVLVTMLLCLPLFVNAQQNTVSPYSYYGIGEFQPQGFALNNDLGGVGISMRSKTHLNPLNPASLSGLSLTAFETGVNGSMYNLSDNQYEQEFFTSTLAYLSLGFPIAKNFAISGGLMPYTFQGYETSQDFEDVLNESDTITYTQKHIGSGGFNKAYANFGWQVYKGLSVGATGSMLFGTLNQTTDVEMSAEHAMHRREKKTYYVREFFFDFGLQYETKVADKSLVIGATYAPETSMEANFSHSVFTYDISGDFEYVKDTATTTSTTTDAMVLPMSYGFGLSLEKPQNWMIAGEYAFKDWSQLSLYGVPEYGLVDASEFRLGAWWIPNYKDVHNYWSTVQYRMGLRYNTGMLSIAANNSDKSPSNIDDMSASLGFGLPLKKSKTMLNIGLEFGKRGTIDSNLVEEQYLKFHLAFTFNDKWFTKRKID